MLAARRRAKAVRTSGSRFRAAPTVRTTKISQSSDAPTTTVVYVGAPGSTPATRRTKSNASTKPATIVKARSATNLTPASRARGLLGNAKYAPRARKCCTSSSQSIQGGCGVLLKRRRSDQIVPLTQRVRYAPSRSRHARRVRPSSDGTLELRQHAQAKIESERVEGDLADEDGRRASLAGGPPARRRTRRRTPRRLRL